MMVKYLALATGITSIASGCANYYLVKGFFLPVWRGGLEDKTTISFLLIICLVVFLVSLEHFITLTAGAIAKNMRRSDSFDFSLITTTTKAILFPLKCISYFLSMILTSNLFGIGGEFIGCLAVGYIYLFKMPEINKAINSKIAGGFFKEYHVI